MDLKSLRKPKLLELARELGLDVSDKLRKSELLRAILELEAEDDELSECLETIEEREQKEERERKEQKEKDERERKEQKDKEKEERSLEMKRLEVEMERARNGSQAHGAGERVSFKMTDLMRPFKLGEDIGLFLVNFKRTSDHLLREKGLLFGEASVQALTRSRVRELAAKGVVAGPTLSNNEKGSEAQQADIPSTSELDKIEPVALKAPGTGEEMPDTGKLEELPVELPGLGSVTNREGTDQVISDLLSKAPLSAEQKTELHQLLQEFQEPVRSKAYRVSPRQRDIMEAEVKKMLQLGVIEAGESDYTTPLILVEVPGKEPRPCVDYRRLNSITKDQIYPIPNIEERLEKVSSAQFISTLDLVRGYWQVPLTEEASRYAAFISPMATFRPKVLSFGLKNAPYCFSSLMYKVLRGQEEFALPYLDDVAIFSPSWSEHMAHLRAVLTRLREAGLTVKAPKCQLAQAEVVYLGHVIGQGRRRPSEIKVAAVRDFPQPRTKTDIRSFLGVAGYYQRYIPRYSDIAAPLTDALRKTEPQTVVWGETKERAFSALKSALTSQPVLRSPDYTKGFVVQCDASERGMGVVLCQRENGEVEHPVLYASRKLTCREQAYSATEKECACLVWAVQKLSCYLAGSRFIIETDHCPLQWLQTISPKNGRLLRWSLALQQYSSEISRIRRIGVFPVGLVGRTYLSSPVVSRKGVVVGFYDSWLPEYRRYALDMAGFAVNLELVLLARNPRMPHKKGMLETGFIGSLGTDNIDWELLAGNCTEVNTG
ncbi:hypothetical protein V5799_006147 [Amblyomma americanum]|uniref:Galactosylgalactosylxylosylprotein 3-beta-glucuronosyltransferase n=1 Tax=Amblyomma americanum TaxID=6943 RepID=A0AAQ4DX84_AMBAM